MVFTGAMDYWPNVDAVQWFAAEVLPPYARAAHPDARFYIVGAQAVARGAGAGQQPGVIVTGTVPDVRPYLPHARLAVAPLRIARGIQNKVLEAMAMAKPVVVLAAGAGGHRRRAGQRTGAGRRRRRIRQAWPARAGRTARSTWAAPRARRSNASYSWDSQSGGVEALLECR